MMTNSLALFLIAQLKDKQVFMAIPLNYFVKVPSDYIGMKTDLKLGR